MLQEKKKGGPIPFLIGLFLAIVIDLSDFFGIGLVPLLGDGIDIVGSAVVLGTTGSLVATAITLPEYIDVLTLTVPIALPIELLPMNTIVILTWKLGIVP